MLMRSYSANHVVWYRSNIFARDYRIISIFNCLQLSQRNDFYITNLTEENLLRLHDLNKRVVEEEVYTFANGGLTYQPRR